MTLLELLVVMALIAIMMWMGVNAIRWVRGPDVSGVTGELSAVARRGSQLAAETGIMHRLVLDLDAQQYRVEICEGGPMAIKKEPDVAKRSEAVKQDDEARKRAVEEAQRRLSTVPQGAMPVDADPDRAEEMALALANQLGARRTCTVADAYSGDALGKPLMRAVDGSGRLKIRQVWVAHLEDSVTSGLVAIHFFPIGSAEKAVIEISDGEDSTAVLVHGLSGRVEVRGEMLRDPDEFMLRDASGEEVQER